MTQEPSQPNRESPRHAREVWILGLLNLAFYGWVFIFAPETLPVFKQVGVAIASALLAGLFAHFLTGKMRLKINGISFPFGKVRVQATEGIAVFVVVLLFWLLSPWAPVTADANSIYRVRIMVVDDQQHPVNNAQILSSLGGEPKQVAGGWQFDIPRASKPNDGKLTITASEETAFLFGQSEIQLGEDPNPVVTVQLKLDASALVRGIVRDDSGRAIAGARVSVIGYEGESTTTESGGNFVLPAHAAENQPIQLHVEKEGYEPTNLWHPAGREPAIVILDKR